VKKKSKKLSEKRILESPSKKSKKNEIKKKIEEDSKVKILKD